MTAIDVQPSTVFVYTGNPNKLQLNPCKDIGVVALDRQTIIDGCTDWWTTAKQHSVDNNKMCTLLLFIHSCRWI